MNSRSISFRLVVWYAGLLAVIFSALFALLYLNVRLFLINDMSQSQVRRAQQVASLLLAQPGQAGQIAAEAKEWFQPEANDRFIRITRADGTVIYVSGAPTDGSFNPRQVRAVGTSSETDFSRQVQLPGNGTLMVTALKYTSPDNQDYLVEYGAPLAPVQTMLDRLFLRLALGLPFAIILMTAGGYWLIRRALAPVEQVTRAAERITQHNLDERLPVSNTGDELERLSISLNRMIVRLNDAFQNSKRFVADASHELRTPLTILRGELETMAEDPRLGLEWRERAASLLEETERLSRIVEQLFTLSRLDAGEAQTEWSEFDLAELARSTAEQMNLLAEDKGISISCAATEPVSVEGDRARLKQVVVNLLDNAIKYTPKNGVIQMRIHAANGHAVLEVEDNGMGIAADALPHVFERFYRVDRTRSGESEGAGLGLSIVKSIATAHGAEVGVTSIPNVGTRFSVKLPVHNN
ncbi:MAG: sensor histidine kinase [Limisphaerales bacterium]